MSITWGTREKSYKKGGKVRESGKARLHAGEIVKKGKRKSRRGKRGNNKRAGSHRS